MSDRTEISETLKAANSYSKLLKNLTNKIQNAEHQICETSKETEKTIETTFTNLLKNITQFLLERKLVLIKRVQETKQQSLAPLEECREDISQRISKTDKLIQEGEYLLNGANKNIAEFNQQSSLLGSLPEIPELKEVPYITFQYESHLELELLDLCKNFGEVSRIAPVQIIQTSEKPGAILVEWQSIENDDRCVDIQEFRLQKGFGDVITEKHLKTNFSDCYTGLEAQFLVKDLRPNQSYSFRVCCKFEGSHEWSPWSLPQVFSTSIRPFSWANNDDFILTNENRIATPVKDLPSLLVSDGPQFAVDYCVEFTYLEFDNKVSTIGLIVTSDANIKKIKCESHSYFALDSNGEIFVNGVKKSTKLPEVAKGLKVCFMCEPIHGEKVRVNIIMCDKQVTYDWQISSTDRFYFAANLKSPVYTPEFVASIPSVNFSFANATKADVRYYLFKSGIQKTAITLNGDFDFPEEDRKLPLKILIHGYTSNITSPWYRRMKNAYFIKGPHNVIYIDWSPAANKSFKESCANVKPVGEYVAEMIIHLKIPLEKVHIIGHSLGSHLAGFIGKNVQKQVGEKVGRITGLDPAGPGFERVGNEERLSKFDASFVDVIHTDAGYYGIIKRIGHVDFFVNGGKFQNGCPQREYDDNCSHARSTKYFIESINIKNVVATPGNITADGSVIPLIKGEEIKFGDATPSTARGIYYLRTNPIKPYLC